ncbi:MAG: helix-turn-helix transcriptional regulator [Erythrobacter sp.]
MDIPSTPSTLIETLDKVSIRGPESITGAAQCFAAIAASLEFQFAVWHDLSSKNGPEDCDRVSLNETVFGWNDRGDRWWDKPQIALASPIALACRYESEPFWMNIDGFHGNSIRSDLALRGLSKAFANPAEVSSLMVIPVHLAFGQTGLVCCLPTDVQKSDLSAEYREYSAMLSLIAHRFLKTYNHVQDTRKEVPSNCYLTRRQVQCLQWASQGKTDRETGMILSLSHAAVRYHLQCAIERLGCVNRTQAVFRAAQLGYVGAI